MFFLLESVATNVTSPGIRSSDNDSTGFWPLGSLHIMGADVANMVKTATVKDVPINDDALLNIQACYIHVWENGICPLFCSSPNIR